MKSFTIKLILYLSSLLYINDITISETIVISKDSELNIIGYSNIKDFKCVLDFSKINYPINIDYIDKNKTIDFHFAELLIENSCFDCGNRAMNKDFLKLLKNDENSYIKLNLKEIQFLSNTNDEVLSKILITIAGKSKLITAPLLIENNNYLVAKGCMNIKLSDFQLKPPKKMLGLVVVFDNIDINFKLKLKKI